MQLNYTLIQTCMPSIRTLRLCRFFRCSREPGLEDRCSPCTQEVEGSTPTRGHMSERFFRSNRPGYLHPVSSELENSGTRVAVGDCSVTERWWWCPPYQTGKTVHYKHNKDSRTAPGVCGSGSVPLSHSGNVVRRIGIHTHRVLQYSQGYCCIKCLCFKKRNNFSKDRLKS